MKNSFHNFTIGLGVASILSGVYWIYRGGELLEIILPIIIGIGVIASGYIGSKKKGTDPK